MSDDIAIGLADAEELLASASFLDCRSLWHSSNYVYLARLCGPAGEPFAAIYKPLAGESPLWDFPEGLYRREVAAYRFSRALGWDFVPPTVVRDGPQGPGSVQVFIPHDPEAHFFVQRERAELLPQLMRMCVFDVVANNADRKGGHCLLDERDHIWGIDHGLCFHAAYKLRSVIWDWAGEAIPEALLEDLEEAGLAIAAETEEARPLLGLLHEDESVALLGRIERLLRSRTFPVPGQARHYPWPMV